jgi:hypothetical protein
VDAAQGLGRDHAAEESESSSDRPDLVARARAWLRGGARGPGRKDMLRYIFEGLLVNMQIEREEGERTDDGEKGSRATARQSRKLFQDTATLVMQIHEQLKDEEG